MSDYNSPYCHKQAYIELIRVSWKPATTDRYIVKDVSAKFSRGIFTAILGPNGAGKTSLIKLILGFRQPQHGEIMINRRGLADYRRKELARELAYLPQNSRSNYDLPVREVVRMARYSRLGLFAQPGSQDEEAVTEALERSGAVNLAAKNFADLSGGERQRVLCARAIAQESRFILLDEPVSNLDLRYQHTILATLSRLAKEKNVGIICVMHDVNLAKQYADELVLIKEGRAIEQGPAGDLLREDLLTQVYDWPLREIISKSGEESFFISQSARIP